MEKKGSLLRFITKTLNKHRITRYALIVVIAELYLLHFSVSTSPLYSNYFGGDSAFFILVGKGMKYGYLPYRDFFDMKGPWLFVVEWIGQLVSEGRFGAFLLQSINMSASLIMFDKLIGIGREDRKTKELFFLIPLLATAIFSVGEGNLTEELSLFPLSVSLYLGLRYMASDEKEHKPLFAAIYGCCFGYLSLIRIINAALICAVVLTITVTLITRKLWKNLLYNAIAFVVGVCIAFLPILVFLGINGLLDEMFYQVFGYGISYANSAGNVGWKRLFFGSYKEVLYPFYVGMLASLILIQKNNWYITLLIWSSTIGTMAAIALSGRNFDHYYALLIPIVALDVWYLYWMLRATTDEDMKSISDGDGVERHHCFQRKNSTVVFILVIVFIGSYYGTYKLDREYVAKNINVNHNHAADEAIIDLALHISDNESVYAWTPQPRWYMYAEKFPCFRYCGWQTDQMMIDPSIRGALEAFFLSNPPIWLVIENNTNKLPSFVDESIEKFFIESYRNNYWILYHRERDT